ANHRVRLGLDDTVWKRYCVARTWPRLRHGTRASESVCGDSMERAGRLQLPRKAAERLGSCDNVSQHFGKAQLEPSAGFEVGSGFDYGIRIRTRIDRAAAPVRRNRHHAAG